MQRIHLCNMFYVFQHGKNGERKSDEEIQNLILEELGEQRDDYEKKLEDQETFYRIIIAVIVAVFMIFMCCLVVIGHFFYKRISQKNTGGVIKSKKRKEGVMAREGTRTRDRGSTYVPNEIKVNLDY